MNVDLVAMAFIFKLCYGAALCKVEPWESPCTVRVVVMRQVPTDPNWWNWTERNLYIMQDQKLVNICKEVPDASPSFPKAE